MSSQANAQFASLARPNPVEQARHETLPEPLTGLAGLLGLPTFLEARAGLEYLRLLNDPVWRRRESAAAASRPVLLVPGFMGTPASLAPMRQWFQRQGCEAEVASIGLNAGPSADAAHVVLQDVRRMAAESGQKVLIIGHSRGGQHARVAAVRASEAVEVLVTLGTPLRVIMVNHALVRLPVSLLSGLGRRIATDSQRAAEADYERDLLGPLPPDVRHVSLWSKTDGIVDWRVSVDHGVESHRVEGSHIGLTVNPEVYRALVPILERTTQRSTQGESQ